MLVADVTSVSMCAGGHAASAATSAGSGHPGQSGDAGSAFLLEPEATMGRSATYSSLKFFVRSKHLGRLGHDDSAASTINQVSRWILELLWA